MSPAALFRLLAAPIPKQRRRKAQIMDTNEKLKILVADDADIGRSILRALLRKEFDVVEARNGAEAVNALSTEGGRFAAVILDVMMPVMDGFGVLKFMEENGLVGSFPVIMLTAIADQDAKARCYDAGATDVVEKPYDEKLLVRKVRAIASLFAAAHASAAPAAQHASDAAEARAGFFEGLLDSIPDAVYATDPDTHRVTWANAVFRELPGVPEEPVGTDIRECLPSAAESIVAVWEDLTLRRVRSEREFRIQGDSRVFRLSYNALLDDAGGISDLVGCISDVTPKTSSPA